MVLFYEGSIIIEPRLEQIGFCPGLRTKTIGEGGKWIKKTPFDSLLTMSVYLKIDLFGGNYLKINLYRCQVKII